MHRCGSMYDGQPCRFLLTDPVTCATYHPKQCAIRQYCSSPLRFARANASRIFFHWWRLLNPIRGTTWFHLFHRSRESKSLAAFCFFWDKPTVKPRLGKAEIMKTVTDITESGQQKGSGCEQRRRQAKSARPRSTSQNECPGST